MTPELRAVVDRLDELAAGDPRLEQHRIQPNPSSLSLLPSGWHLSTDMASLIAEGGFWPGEFSGQELGAPADYFFPFWGLTDGPEPTVNWFGIGSVFERDHCLTPALHDVEPTAPVLMWSSSGLWTSMVFPTEASILEAFLITYETCGSDQSNPNYPEIDPMFVEWVLEPVQGANDAQAEAHRRIAERATAWQTEHPTWHHETMPFFTDGDFDVQAEAALFGVDAGRVKRGRHR